MILEDSSHEFYTIQQRVVKQSVWMTKQPLHDVDGRVWDFANFDVFGIGKMFQIFPGHDVKMATCYDGWWTLDETKKVVNEIRELDQLGKYDSYNVYHKHCQSIRHEFRIVKMTTMKHIEIVEE